jgi:hypothetical protein
MFNSSKKKQVLKCHPKRHCACGAKDYSRFNFDDMVHCNSCGAVYFLGVLNPVAKWVYEDEKLQHD